MALAKGVAEWPKTHPKESINITLVTKSPAGDMDDSLLPFRVVRHPNLWNFVQLIRSSDVVHVAGPAFLPMLLGLIFRKPTVVEHHGYQSVCPNGLLFYWPNQTVCPGHFMAQHYGECVRCNSGAIGWARSFLSTIFTFPRRWLGHRVAANVMISNHVGMRLMLPRSRTIYYGIEDIPASGTAKPPRQTDTLEVAYVGRLITEKGLPVLLNAAKCLKDQGAVFRLSVIGGGPEQGQLEQMAKSLGLSEIVTFTGDLRGSALKQSVGEIAVVVMPSVCEETAGLSAIEQMMRGRAVIASDIGGLTEVVGDAGLKFVPGDSQALASCIRRIINDPVLAASLGSAARTRALQLFSLGSMIQRHLSLYREAFACRERRHSK
jgi:glycosyltransferase involved in cell wall biosynthesis